MPDYELRPFKKLVKSDYFRINNIPPIQLKRTKLLLIYPISRDELLKVPNDYI